MFPDEVPGVDWIGVTGDFVRVIDEKCDGCACCVRVCLGECFEIHDKKARVRSLARCMECAACWYVCPKEAIIFNWPQGGTGFRTDWG